jgi:solute carrier family 25 protein 39/40
MEAKKLLGYDERSPNPILPVIAGLYQKEKDDQDIDFLFAIIGACSRIVAVTTVSPFELFRTKMQSEKVRYQQLFRIVRTSLAEEGPRVLWRGLLPTLWRDIPFSMIYWFNYETFRGKYIGNEDLYQTFLFSFVIAYLVRSNITVDSYATFACGALAGGIAATLTTPADVAKTFRQIELGRSKYSPTPGCVKCSSISINQPIQSTKTLSILLHIFQVEGPKGLFAGLY